MWSLNFNMATVCTREQRNETSAMNIPAKHQSNLLLFDVWWVSVSLSCSEGEKNDAHVTLSSHLRFRPVALPSLPSSFHLLPTVRLSTHTQRKDYQHCIFRGSFHREQETPNITTHISADGLRTSNLFSLATSWKLCHPFEFATHSPEWGALLRNRTSSSFRN